MAEQGLPGRNLTRFDGKNLMYWKFQITTALVAHDLLDIVTGATPRPAEAAASANDAARQAVEQAIKTWVIANAKAKIGRAHV